MIGLTTSVGYNFYQTKVFYEKSNSKFLSCSKFFLIYELINIIYFWDLGIFSLHNTLTTFTQIDKTKYFLSQINFIKIKQGKNCYKVFEFKKNETALTETYTLKLSPIMKRGNVNIENNFEDDFLGLNKTLLTKPCKNIIGLKSYTRSFVPMSQIL